MAKRDNLTQMQKYVGFRTAFDTYKNYMNSQNYIGAYVVAFSILEDRVNALFLIRKQIQNETPEKYTPFTKKLNYLLRYQDIDSETQISWRICADQRNNKIHNAMWNINEFNEIDCNKILMQSRKADKLRRKQKISFGRNPDHP